ncbi:hypothetical protein DBR42_20880 [Pelomonas sp. HMWF004]|nr:hypothetical protein DBR42_20880 [Pelomonas sp. HMWF004]
MKARKSQWLDTALRAQQARTLDHHYRVHETQASYDQAAQQESGAQQSLNSLAGSWRKGRDVVQLTEELDRLYRRFHSQLHAQATEAAQTRVFHRQALDTALLHLQQSHALQQGLDKTRQRRDRRIAKDALVAERHAASETWMLVQAGKKESE